MKRNLNKQKSNTNLPARIHNNYDIAMNQSTITGSSNFIDDLYFMNSQEAARFLGISTKFLMNLTSCGRVPYFKFGRSNRYLKSELVKLIFENRRGPLNGL